MKQTELIMGMPISVEIVATKDHAPLKQIFDYFKDVDSRFSPYKEDSELAKLNNGLDPSQYSKQMKEVMELCEQTKQMTSGYFDINRSGKIDPSGLVKGWAISNAAKMLKNLGYANFYIEAGGDIQAEGTNEQGEAWLIGIRNPFNIDEIVKVIRVSGRGVATSGAYIRGEHIYNPRNHFKPPKGITSLSVIANDIFDADRFATAAYAMGPKGINLIAHLPGFAAYLIDDRQIATYSNGFEAYVV